MRSCIHVVLADVLMQFYCIFGLWNLQKRFKCYSSVYQQCGVENTSWFAACKFGEDLLLWLKRFDIALCNLFRWVENNPFYIHGQAIKNYCHLTPDMFWEVFWKQWVNSFSDVSRKKISQAWSKNRTSIATQ